MEWQKISYLAYQFSGTMGSCPAIGLMYKEMFGLWTWQVWVFEDELYCYEKAHISYSTFGSAKQCYRDLMHSWRQTRRLFEQEG